MQRRRRRRRRRQQQCRICMVSNEHGNLLLQPPLLCPLKRPHMSGVSLQSIVAQGTVEVPCGANVGSYTGGLNAESRPHGFGGRWTESALVAAALFG